MIGRGRRSPARSERRDPGADVAAAIVGFSARRLASSRPEWGQAMHAELAYLQGGWTRFRFAVGCGWAALVAPRVEARGARTARTVVAVTVLAVLGLGLLAQRRALAAPATGQHGSAYELAVTLLGATAIGWHWWRVDRHARRGSASARAAQRTGATVGVVVGVVAVLTCLPVPLFSTPLAAGLAFPVLAGGGLLAGVRAARVSGERASGCEAGVWAGRVAGSLMAVGLLAATLWASGWLVQDSTTISAYRDSLSPARYGSYGTHFQTITGFVEGENVDTALIGAVLVFPLTGTVAGTVGGALSTLGRRRRPGRRRGHRPGADR